MADALTRAREIVAARYTDVIDGKAHVSIPGRAVLRGEWDTGKLVRDALAEVERDG